MADELDLENLEGVGPITKNKLIDNGIHNILDLVVHGPVELRQVTGMSSDVCEKIVTTARKQLEERGTITRDFQTAKEIAKKRESIEMITTGSKALDALLKGGIETQALTETYGEFGSGKTQLCHTLCVMVQKPKSEGGLDGDAVYFDTEGTFRPERIREIAIYHGMDPDEVLEHITVSRAMNSSHQILLAENVGTIFKGKNVRLIIADSLTGLFRSEYLGRGTLAERQQQLGRYIRLLSKIAGVYNCAIVGTNQVSASPDAPTFVDPTRPVGGHVVGHGSTYRLYFKKSSKSKRIVKIMDSPHHPLSEEGIELGLGGIVDTEEYLKSVAKKAEKAAKEKEKKDEKKKEKKA